MYEDDFEPDEDEMISTNIDALTAKTKGSRPKLEDEDEEDFAEGEEYDVKTWHLPNSL